MSSCPEGYLVIDKLLILTIVVGHDMDTRGAPDSPR